MGRLDDIAMLRWVSRLPPLPWRLCLAALAARFLLQDAALAVVPAGLSPWLACLDELLFSYAALLLGTWVLVDVPTSLALWRQPPRILRDLSLMLIGTAITVVIVQQQVRINLVSLVTASAVLTAVIGLAAQETLKDLFAGITLQLDPPFKLGDWIALGEVRGVVTGFTLMNTELSNLDGSKVVLPNSFVAEEQLRRFRAEDPLGVHFSIGLDYSFPPAQAQQLLLKVLHNNPWVLSEPPSRVWIDTFAESAIAYEILAYKAGSAQFAMRDFRSALLLDIWYALRRQGQSIPFPVRQLKAPHSSTSLHAGGDGQALTQRLRELERNPLFAALDQNQLQLLAGLTSTQVYAPGEAVVVEGDLDGDLYQVISGSLEVTTTQPESGQELLVSILSRGDLFGEMSLLLDSPRSATVRAVDEVVLLQVQRHHLAPILEADPLLYEQFAKIVQERRQELASVVNDSNDQPNIDVIRKMKDLFAALLGSG